MSAFCHFDINLSPPGAVEFTEVDSLPGSKDQSAVFNDHLLGKTEKACLDMSSGIAFHMHVAVMKGDDLIHFL